VRIAYLVLAHHRPRQLARLVRRLSGPERCFFIHFDAAAPAAFAMEAKRALAGTREVEFVESVRCAWGDLSLVAAAMRCLRCALQSRFDVAVLLSGQDYPLASNAAIVRFFEEADGRSVMEHWRLPSERWANEANGEERYLYWNVRIGRRFLPLLGPRGFGNRAVHEIWNRAARLNPIRRRFPHGMTPYGGSAWWALARDDAAHVVRFVAEHDDYVRFFHWVKIPDEMFFQTIVLNGPGAERVVNRSLHYLSWPPLGATSPRTLGIGDLAALEISPHLFARKFDEAADAEILDHLDARIDGTRWSASRASYAADAVSSTAPPLARA
jgi:hypothetical protein